MFKICSIGCGGMAKSGHGPAFAKYKKDYKDVCLAACCDINEEAAKAFKENFGFEAYYTDYQKMLEEVKPDVVLVHGDTSTTFVTALLNPTHNGNSFIYILITYFCTSVGSLQTLH